MTEHKLYHHTFSPWTVADGTRVIASERAWSRVLKWDKDAFAAQREADREAMANTPMDCVPAMPMRLPRPRVLVGVDVFEDWNGPMVDSFGAELYDDMDGGFTEAQIGYGDIPLPGQSPIGMPDVRRRLFGLIDQTPNIDWLLLTKRPENIERMMPPVVMRRDPEQGPYRHPGMEGMRAINQIRPNLWLGTSITTQAEADERIPHLLKRPAAVRYVMVTPREEIDLSRWLSALNLAIVSGDTEPMHPDWVRSLRDQCQAALVPFWFEGWGEWAPFTDNVDRHYKHGRPTFGDTNCEYNAALNRMIKHHGGTKLVDDRPEGWQPYMIEQGMGIKGGSDDELFLLNVGKKAAGRLLDGRTWNELPEGKK